MDMSLHVLEATGNQHLPGRQVPLCNNLLTILGPCHDVGTLLQWGAVQHHYFLRILSFMRGLAMCIDRDEPMIRDPS